MKLRYRVDQAYCFRHGIDAPVSIDVIEVNPADLSQEDRNLIADRLDGIDVCKLVNGVKPPEDCADPFIMAQRPGLAYLLEACRANEDECNDKLAP